MHRHPILPAFFAFVFFWACVSHTRGRQEKDPGRALINRHYDKAFGYYHARRYSKAIEHWDQILQIDPQQVTAKKMIGEARKKLGEASKAPEAVKGLIAKGRYHEALLKVYELLDQDPSSPFYRKLQGRLEKLVEIVPRRPVKTKAWRIAGIGIKVFLSKSERPRLAYDALRYARELRGRDARLEKILSLFESEHPDLASQERVPPGVSFLEYKKNVALHYIYDGKYHLAVKDLSSILVLEPKDVTALKRIGSAYLQLKDKARAKKAWLKAYKLAPKDSQLKKSLDRLK